MESENYILIHQYCKHTQTPIDFIYSLHEYGFIKVTHVENQEYVKPKDLVEIERVSRLKNELGINLEGIDAINHMIKKINRLENELRMLRERLRIYEP
ncbi:chaperone modulator CbpM [Maribacter aestuarii]|uniref:chaperone modulator CbpM n=1 Tax=Maribacter aestuarii TaxID=1130723 RepID=UPI00248C1A38|nr:chaperone modulator CbpM [Maribacter aestuarii]